VQIQGPEHRDFRHAVHGALRAEVDRLAVAAEESERERAKEQVQLNRTIAELREEVLVGEEQDESNRAEIERLNAANGALRVALERAKDAAAANAAPQLSSDADDAAEAASKAERKRSDEQLAALQDMLRDKEMQVQSEQRAHADEVSRLSAEIATLESRLEESTSWKAEADRLRGEVRLKRSLPRTCRAPLRRPCTTPLTLLLCIEIVHTPRVSASLSLRSSPTNM
jgi:chromosome segregation ATPase